MPKTFTYEKNRKNVHGYFPSELHEKLLKRARENKRSLNSELVAAVEKAFKHEEQEQELVVR